MPKMTIKQRAKVDTRTLVHILFTPFSSRDFMKKRQGPEMGRIAPDTAQWLIRAKIMPTDGQMCRMRYQQAVRMRCRENDHEGND
jgi:hypothetical protein